MYGAVALIFLLALATASANNSKVDDLRHHVVDTIESLWYETTETNDINNSPNLKDTDVMDRFREISKNITDTEETLKFEMPVMMSLSLEWAQVVQEIFNIGEFFNALKRLHAEPVRWRHELAWTDMAQYFLDITDKGVNSSLSKLHEYTKGNTISVFGKALQDSRSNMCELQQSQQELIYHMYNMISISELKGYTMLQFAWMMLKVYDKGNFTAEADLMRELYTKRALEKMDAAKAAMKGADRSRYNCDPRKWTEGENYVRLTKLLQGYIENEVNLNAEGTCGNNCKYYERTEYHGCFKQQFCAKQRPCQGEVLHCTYYDSDMNICQASQDTDRRYDWIEYENHMIFGQKSTCPNRQLKVDSWWRYLFWHCSYCFCLCDDKHPSSDRYFNLRETMSDVSNNKVITGVRFVKDKQIIHIQIQEGLLEPQGIVNKSSVEWKPIDSYSVRDDHVKNGIDYHTMTYINRAIDLDDNIAPPSYALTGVRLRLIGKSLNMEIAATPFDFSTGRLHSVEESLWVGNENTDGNPQQPRSEIKLTDPDLPTKQVRSHLPDSRHDQFIQFRESSMSGDAAQTTVPFIDAQALQSEGLVLSGLGVHHRGSYRSGGFVALKLFTYDFTPHMVSEIPKVDVA